MTDEPEPTQTTEDMCERIIELLEAQIVDLKADRDSWKATAINNLHALRDVYRKPKEDEEYGT